MSIINDALKKAQANMQKNPNDPQQKMNGSSNPKKDFIKDNLKHIAKEKKKQNLEDLGGSSQAPAGEPSTQQKTEVIAPPHKEKKEKAVRYKEYGPSKIPLLIFLLICLGAAVYWYYLRPGRSSLTKKSIRVVTEKLPDMRSFKRTIPKPIRRPVVAKPTRRPTPSRGMLELNGIVMMGSRRVALINNDIYEVGDMVDDKKILKIATDRVELQDGNKTVILTVSK